MTLDVLQFVADVTAADPAGGPELLERLAEAGLLEQAAADHAAAVDAPDAGDAA